jgi:hypothetical protein
MVEGCARSNWRNPCRLHRARQQRRQRRPRLHSRYTRPRHRTQTKIAGCTSAGAELPECTCIDTSLGDVETRIRAPTSSRQPASAALFGRALRPVQSSLPARGDTAVSRGRGRAPSAHAASPESVGRGSPGIRMASRVAWTISLPVPLLGLASRFMLCCCVLDQRAVSPWSRSLPRCPACAGTPVPSCAPRFGSTGSIQTSTRRESAQVRLVFV